MAGVCEGGLGAEVGAEQCGEERDGFNWMSAFGDVVSTDLQCPMAGGCWTQVSQFFGTMRHPLLERGACARPAAPYHFCC